MLPLFFSLRVSKETTKTANCLFRAFHFVKLARGKKEKTYFLPSKKASDCFFAQKGEGPEKILLKKVEVDHGGMARSTLGSRRRDMATKFGLILC